MIENAGLKIANMGDTSVHNMPEVTLGLDGRGLKEQIHQKK